MANYAIVENTKVINTCAWDGLTEWSPPEGTQAIEIPEGVIAGTGYDYINGQFIAPPLPDPLPAEPEDPLAALTIEQKQALVDLLNAGLV